MFVKESVINKPPYNSSKKIFKKMLISLSLVRGKVAT